MNFSNFEKIMSNIKSGVKPSYLAELKNELNKFFRDSTCMEVIWTENTDKMFFGMCVFPAIPAGYVTGLIDGELQRFSKYYIELDSKLFDRLLNLSNRQLTAILLHEVGHIVNNVKVSRELSDSMVYIISKDGVRFDYEAAEKNSKFMMVGIQRAIRKLTSIFEKNEEEFIADEFVVKCGYGADLESAYDRIVTERDSLNKNIRAKLTTLVWSLNVYRELGSRRREILEQLDRAENSEPSTLFKKLYKSAYDSIKNFDLRTASISENAVREYLNESEFLKKIKYSTLKSIEEDLYEFNIRVKNIEDQTEAMDIMRSLTMRISIIEEYIAKENPPKQEAERLNSICDKFKFLREELVRNGTYNKTFYGLWVKYPEVK